MIRCAIYTRSATVASYPCEAQRDACAAVADARGWTVLAERFDDPLSSGIRSERPGLSRLRQRARDAQVAVVLVWRMDRLSRSLRRFRSLSAELRSHGVPVLSV
ncbi:MAG: recombinase family protein, partial [Polyangiaceae bacterium]